MLVPKTYANRTQAYRAAVRAMEETGESWGIYHPAMARPFYVARLYEGGSFVPPKPRAPAEEWLTKYAEEAPPAVAVEAQLGDEVTAAEAWRY